MREVVLLAPEIHCDQCKTSIEGAVGAMSGVTSVEVDIAEASVRVAYEEQSVDLTEIKRAIEGEGYAVFG